MAAMNASTLCREVGNRLTDSGFHAKTDRSLVWVIDDWKFEIDFAADGKAEFYVPVDVDFAAFNPALGRFAKKFGNREICNGNAFLSICLDSWNVGLRKRMPWSAREAHEALESEAKSGMELAGLRGEVLRGQLEQWRRRNLLVDKDVPAGLAAEIQARVLPVCGLLLAPRELFSLVMREDLEWLSFVPAAHLFACYLGEHAVAEYAQALAVRKPELELPRVPWAS